MPIDNPLKRKGGFRNPYDAQKKLVALPKKISYNNEEFTYFNENGSFNSSSVFPFEYFSSIDDPRVKQANAAMMASYGLGPFSFVVRALSREHLSYDSVTGKPLIPAYPGAKVKVISYQTSNKLYDMYTPGRDHTRRFDEHSYCMNAYIINDKDSMLQNAAKGGLAYAKPKYGINAVVIYFPLLEALRRGAIIYKDDQALSNGGHAFILRFDNRKNFMVPCRILAS